MPRRGPIPLFAHEMVEPVLGVLLVLAPFVLGFDDDAAKTVSIALGVIVLLSGMTTRWRLSLLKLIPLRIHFMTDALLGVVAILAPFVLGFSDETRALVWFLVVGVGELAAAFGTDWSSEDARLGGARRTAPARMR